MHARTATRRFVWIAGAIAATVAGSLVAPVVGALIAGSALAFLIGSAMRPGSDFYLRSLRRGSATVGRVALTFDDGPDPVRTPQVLDALAENDARATFFMIGRRAAESPALVQRAVAAGHEIGGHSQSHERTLPFRSKPRQREEIRDCVATLRAAGAPEPRWYRPPMGYATPALADALAETPLRSVNWSVHAHDLADPDEDRIVARVLDRARAGDIVLFHDGSDRLGAGPAAVPGAVRRIVRGLRERGLEPTTLSELLDGEPLP